MDRLLQRLVTALLLAIAGLSAPGFAFAQANYTALWWNPAESGWGINVNHQGDIVFATLFTYGANGTPLWLVMSAGMRQGSSDTFTGDLYRTTGPAFNANPFTPIGAANLTRVGSMTLAFSGAGAATLTYSVDGASVVKTISRQVFGSAAATCQGTAASRASATNYQDLWWNPSESGWGINLTHQDNVIFATLFTYGADNQVLWLVMSAGDRQSDGSYQGTLYRTAGPRFDTQPWTGVTVTAVGIMRLRFTNGEQGTLEYSVDGVAVSKQIRRQEFSTQRPLCSIAAAPPPESGECPLYVRGRVLTVDRLRTDGTVSATYRRSYGPDTTFNGQAVQVVMDEFQPQTTTSQVESYYIQDLATEQRQLGQRTVVGTTNILLTWQPIMTWPKQWSAGQGYAYSGQYLPTGTGPQQPTSYSVSGSMIRRERVTVPAGTFEACYFRLNVVSSTTPVTIDRWLAPGVGEVKAIATSGSTTATYLLRQLQ